MASMAFLLLLQIAVSCALPILHLNLNLILILILSASSSALLFPCANGDASLDVASLLAFKSSAQDPLLVLRDWTPNTSSNVCAWTGVTCSKGHPRRVVHIDLSNKRLGGCISPHVGNLSYLQVLNISFNAFFGYIPSSLGRLHMLDTLDLQENSLSGAIPTHLGNLSSLRILNLGENDLDGGIPSSLGQIANLETFSLYNNSYLGGPIPSSLGRLKKLKKYLSSGNGHSGHIPLTLCNCSLLSALDLSKNQLRGTIPYCLGSLSQLYWLSLKWNSLHGEIPESIWNLTALQRLALGFNDLTGTVPASLGKLSRLQYLNLGSNDFVGSIPENLGNCTELTSLGLMGNQLRGELPMWLGRISKLQSLLLYGNKFTGEIPDSLKNCTNLQHLELQKNQLKGTIPSFLGELSQLSWLSLYSNYFVSGSSNPREPIPALRMLYNCSQLTRLYLGNNFLRGTLPWDMGTHWPLISHLSLSDCNISGHIPETIGNFSSLLALYLGGNLLSGNIPHRWGNTKGIQNLYLSYNKLSGGIPWQITLLNGSLSYLYLQNNKLAGPLPPFIGTLAKLQELDLSGNSFSSRIPPQLGKCKDLLFLNLSSNKFSGTIPPEVVGLKHIQTCFDLSKNFLTGNVPADIEGLNMAEVIDLSRNQLRGNIGFRMDQWLNALHVNLSFNNFSGEFPEAMAKNLTQLHFMDVSHNNFTGLIPESLFDLSQLQYVDLSYNNFQGRVPCSSTFSNHSKFSLTHNFQLCGNCFSLPKRKTLKYHRLFYHQIFLRICISISGALIAFFCIVLLILKRKVKTSCTTETRRLFLWVSLEEIQAATQNFSTINLIGQGRHGLVYKGTLQRGEEIAVKVFSDFATSDPTTFSRECETLGKVRHRNLMRIITACSTLDFKALILPLMPNNLHKLLHEADADVELSGNLFNLEIRLRILRDLAAALSYLHHDCSPPIVHCDVKPQNILLDDEMTVHLSDFGIARLLSQGSTSPISSTVTAIGSPGYIAPEYGSTTRISAKGDVYSFGIVVLEVLTGLMPTHPMFNGDLTLSKWISAMFLQNLEDREERRECVKEVVGKGRRGVEREIEKEEEWRAVEEAIKVGMMCSCARAEERPSMRDVQGMLYSISAHLHQSESESENENEMLGRRRECETFEIFLQRIENAERESHLKKGNKMHGQSSSNSFL